MLVLVALVPPTAVAVIVALEERSDARSRAQTDLLDITRLAAFDAQAEVDATARFLSAVAEDLATRPGAKHCQRLLALVPRSTDLFSSVGVASPSGRVYCGTTTRGVVQPIERVDVSKTAWFRRAQTEPAFVLGDLGAGPFSRMTALLASHAVDRGRFRRPAVVFAALDLTRSPRRSGCRTRPAGRSTDP